MRIGASVLLFGIVAASLILPGCNDSHQQQSISANNISENPLTIKGLALGKKYEADEFPEVMFRTGNAINFKYDYFGQEQLVSAQLDADEVIYSYKISFRGNLTDMRKAIEQKISSENDKDVKFNCTTVKKRLGGMDWEEKICDVVSGTQVLRTEEIAPVSTRPPSLSESAWDAMHMANLTLQDVELANKNARLIEEIDIQKHQEAKAKAMSDI